MEYYEILKEIRIDKDLSQTQVAKKLGTKKEIIIYIISRINSKSKQKIEAYFRTNNITRKAKRKNSDYEFSR